MNYGSWGPEVIDYGDLNQFHWERPLDFDASDVVLVASTSQQDNGGLNVNHQEDPDKALREGALCLVDPNGLVSFTLPLLGNTMNSDTSQYNYQSSTQTTGTHSQSKVQVGSSSYIPSPIYDSPNNESSVNETMWETTQKAVLATPRRLGKKFAEALNQQSTGRWPKRNPETPLHEPAVPDNCNIM